MVKKCTKNVFGDFLRFSGKTILAEVGVAYMRRCSSIVHTHGYEVFDCATKYAGVISVTDFAKKQRHLVVFLVCNMKVTHRIYNFSPALKTLPNKKDFVYVEVVKNAVKAQKNKNNIYSNFNRDLPVLLARSLIKWPRSTCGRGWWTIL